MDGQRSPPAPLTRFARRYLIADAAPLSRAERLRSALAALIGLLIYEAVLFVAPVAPEARRALAPLGATAVILFTLPHSPLAQPWSVAGGLLLPALTALLLAPGGPLRCACLALSLVAGGVQAYHALRCGLDAALFAHWASAWQASTEADIEADLQAFDQALVETFGQPARTPRPLAERVRGALRLLRHQALALALQGLTLFAAMVAG